MKKMFLFSRTSSCSLLFYYFIAWLIILKLSWQQCLVIAFSTTYSTTSRSYSIGSSGYNMKSLLSSLVTTDKTITKSNLILYMVNDNEDQYELQQQQQQQQQKQPTLKKKTRKSQKNNPKHIKAKSIAKGRDPLISLNMNLDYLAKTGAPRRAEELLLRIENLYKEGYYAAKPDIVSYNSVMYAYAFNKSEEYDSTEEVLRIFNRMQELSKEDRFVQPNVITLNILIRCFAKSGDADRAKKMLDDMENAYQTGSKQMGPNTLTYNTVIDAYAKSKRPEEAEGVLKQMMLISREEPERDEQIKADTISFNSVLHAWQVSGKQGAALRSQQLLDHMIKLYHAGNNNVKPDAYSYTATISSWANERRHPEALEKTMELLHKMQNLCALGDDDLCPNTVAYTAVISALARSGREGAADQAYDILLQMDKQFREGNEDLKPDFICYSAVIDALAKSENEDAGSRALELLNYMITLTEMGYEKMRPNSQVYLSVINALGKSKARGNADAAQKLLNEMERCHAIGDSDVAPNTIIFNAVIHSWAISSFVFKADRAYMLLKRMEEEAKLGNKRCEPDIISYNSVILAAANSFGDSKIKSKAFQIAMIAFKTIMSSSHLNQSSRSYAIFLKALRKLYDPGQERDLMVGKVFKSCVRDGLLNQFVFSQAQMTCTSNDIFRGILSRTGCKLDDNDSIELKRLPKEWQTNSSKYSMSSEVNL